MSTRIFTGFQIATSSLPEVYEIIHAFRPSLKKESRQIMKRFMETAVPGDTTKGWMACAAPMNVDVQRSRPELSL